MRCPICQSRETKCIDSREIGVRRRRRYACLFEACCTRFTTYEFHVDHIDILVEAAAPLRKAIRALGLGKRKGGQRRPVKETA